jgi:hypothetical protein
LVLGQGIRKKGRRGRETPESGSAVREAVGGQTAAFAVSVINMATLATDQPSLASLPDLTASDNPEQNDPFLTASTSSNHHRFSHFDNQLFALGPTTSPEQAKRALEAHLAETERRIQEASKLGTTLVQQRKDLAERLKDVEKQQSEGDITPELRQKLVEIEKEYNEVGRESARAFLPKSRVSSNEMGGGSPFTGDVKVAH